MPRRASQKPHTIAVARTGAQQRAGNGTRSTPGLLRCTVSLVRKLSVTDEELWKRIADAEERRIGSDELGALTEATEALLLGNLAPLAAFLRAGYPLHIDLRRAIVEFIEGTYRGGVYKPLRLKKNRRGPGSPRKSLETFSRYLQIWQFVEWRLPQMNGDVEAAVHEAMAKFSVARSTVMKARAFMLEWNEQQKERLLAEWSEQKRK